MSSGLLQFKVICFMTPQDLREIADEMERRWPELLAGQSLFVKEWFVDNQASIEFHMDQDRCRRQMGMWGAESMRRFREREEKTNG